MATSAVQLCNIALARIGVKRLLSSLDEDSVEAQMCSLLFESTRAAALAAFPWPFATKRAQLAALSGEARSGWAYAYAVPTDCIAPRYLWTGSRAPRPEERTPFAIESKAAGDARVLLTDLSSAELVYTALVSDGALPPLFATALSWLLAAELVLCLPVKPELEQVARQRYLMALGQAQAVELNGQQADPEPDSVFIAARG